MFKSEQFSCACGFKKDELVKDDENVICPKCNQPMLKILSAGHTFSTIVPIYPGSKQRKAGYQHLFKK